MTTRPIYTETEQRAAIEIAKKRYPPKNGKVGLGLNAPQWMKLLAEARSKKPAAEKEEAVPVKTSTTPKLEDF